MPSEDNEVLIVLIAVMSIFLVLTGIITYILFFYQRRRFQHKQQLMEMQKQFNETLLTAQLEIQEHDFRFISREIHDNVGQLLSLAKIQLNIISQSEQLNRNMLNDVKDNIARVMTDLRDIAKSLNGERIEISNLYETIKHEVERINRLGLIHGSVSIEGFERELDMQKKLILFRIVQESLQNILKHSGAVSFFIQLCYLQSGMEIQVSDDGKGFCITDKLTDKGGMGLSNMQNRSALIGGSANIESTEGEGTTISIKISYD
jgi:two-component system, NarL family, sensor kinase